MRFITLLALTIFPLSYSSQSAQAPENTQEIQDLVHQIQTGSEAEVQKAISSLEYLKIKHPEHTRLIGNALLDLILDSNTKDKLKIQALGMIRMLRLADSINPLLSAMNSITFEPGFKPSKREGLLSAFAQALLKLNSLPGQQRLDVLRTIETLVNQAWDELSSSTTEEWPNEIGEHENPISNFIETYKSWLHEYPGTVVGPALKRMGHVFGTGPYATIEMIGILENCISDQSSEEDLAAILAAIETFRSDADSSVQYAINRVYFAMGKKAYPKFIIGLKKILNTSNDMILVQMSIHRALEFYRVIHSDQIPKYDIWHHRWWTKINWVYPFVASLNLTLHEAKVIEQSTEVSHVRLRNTLLHQKDLPFYMRDEAAIYSAAVVFRLLKSPQSQEITDKNAEAFFQDLGRPVTFFEQEAPLIERADRFIRQFWSTWSQWDDGRILSWLTGIPEAAEYGYEIGPFNPARAKIALGLLKVRETLQFPPNLSLALAREVDESPIETKSHPGFIYQDDISKLYEIAVQRIPARALSLDALSLVAELNSVRRLILSQQKLSEKDAWVSDWALDTCDRYDQAVLTSARKMANDAKASRDSDRIQSLKDSLVGIFDEFVPELLDQVTALF